MTTMHSHSHSQSQSKNDEQLLATPILSNRTVPRSLHVNLDNLHQFTLDVDVEGCGPHTHTHTHTNRFSLDSPASALTERSHDDSSHRHRRSQSHRHTRSYERTPRFSCPDEEPIVVPRSRLRLAHRLDAQERERGGLSRSRSCSPDANAQGRNHRIRRRPLALLSSITALVTSSGSNSSSNSNSGSGGGGGGWGRDVHRENLEGRDFVGRTSFLFDARDIFSCWARDIVIEMLRKLSVGVGVGVGTGSFWFCTWPNILYQTIGFCSGFGRPHLPIGTIDGMSLPASQELRIQSNRQKRRRNLAFRRRRERPVCVSGLPNQGQTCFLNSVLQSLASLEPFLEYLEGIVEYQEEAEHVHLSSTLALPHDARNANANTNTNAVFGTGGYGRLFHNKTSRRKMNPSSSSFSKELLELLKGINCAEGVIIADDGEDKNGDKEETTPPQIRRRWRPRQMHKQRTRLDPKALLQKIAKTNPQFSSYGMYEQQDAQELFASLMDVVIHDSKLDASSSDRRMKLEAVSRGEKGGRGTKSNQSRGIDSLERDGDDGVLTSAIAHFNFRHDRKELELEPRAPTRCGDGQITAESAWKNNGDDGDGDGDETNILSLSGLLSRIGKERNRIQAESHRIPNNSHDNRRDYQLNFKEEKKQDHSDISGYASMTTAATTATETSALYRDGFGEQNCHRGLFSPGFSRPGDSVSSGKRLMRSTMSPITPSPLSGWLGSTLRCSKCKHVRPIQNAPFLDIPLVPTSVPNYLSRAYQNQNSITKQKPTCPNASAMPSCSLETCLANFTSVESVQDVECRSCTILDEIGRLEEEATMLRGAIETTERRLRILHSKAKTKAGTTNNNNNNNNIKDKDTHAREIESLDETKCLREDLFKVETRLLELKAEDPDQDDAVSTESSSGNDADTNNEEFFFGATDPRDKSPMQRCRAQKCLLLTRTPSVLCCHIQRRYYDPFTGRMEKCVQFVEFPQFLDLSPYCAYGPRAITPWAAGSLPNASANHAADQRPQQQHQTRGHTSQMHGNHECMPYQLQSVIEHKGNAFGGHYVSYRRDHTGSWFCISDNLVTPVSWRQVQTCQAYLLFYEAM